ncbi:MAG: hypothetical protein ACTHNS_02250 [Marmoricola sp.]
MPQSAEAGARPPDVIGADATGITLASEEDAVLDVCFDGRRVWSFWSVRDTRPADRNRRLAAWPAPLADRLRGSTRLTVGVHGDPHPLFDAETSFGGGDQRLELVDRNGHPLGVDNTGKLVPTFENRSSDQTRPLLDSVVTVLEELGRAGVDAFPAYGTLLGAVREGRLIGHDSDADLGYVSRHTHPFDVVRESFALQRRLVAAGFRVTRYSGASLKVHVEESDGFVRGLDVFGGYFDAQDRLNLLGEVREPFRREWIFPLGTVELEGRALPCPAQPEHLLAAMYGPSWRVPDPAFQFGTPASTVRAFNAMFRVVRARRKQWAQQHARDGQGGPGPSPLARFVVAAEGVPAVVCDVGAGRGHDSLWFAEQGAAVTAYDYITMVVNRTERRARRAELPVEVRKLNLQEWRSTLAEGARLAALPGPRTLVANHVLDAMPAFGRAALGRFASMALRDGGRLYADFWTTPVAGDGPTSAVPLAEVRAVLEAAGARVESAVEDERQDQSGSSRMAGRVVARWA